jgi:hypothetical protein
VGAPENGIEDVGIKIAAFSHIGKIGQLAAELFHNFLGLCQKIRDGLVM